MKLGGGGGDFGRVVDLHENLGESLDGEFGPEGTGGGGGGG